MRAVECMPNKQKLVPPGCRTRQVVGIAYLFDELIRGAQQPDLSFPVGDGADSSRHSLGPRFSGAMRPAIEATYGSEVQAPLELIAGKAPAAIDQEKNAIRADLLILDRNCERPNMAQYGDLWRNLGRLSHYVADLHSPFHANSFGIRQLRADYHEGVIDPANGVWVKGLWDHGIGGRITHGLSELDMGAAADIPRLPCDLCTGPTDPTDMALLAIQTMDTYRAFAFPQRQGYLGLMDDFLAVGIDGVQVRAWGRDRAAKAVGSIKELFEELLEPLASPSCGSDPCQTPQGPGGDHPDEAASNASLGSLADFSSVLRSRAGVHRLAPKKSKRQLIASDLLGVWEGARLEGALSAQQHRDYVDSLGYVSDPEAYFRDYVASADVAVLANGFAVNASDAIEGRTVAEPVMRVAPEDFGADLLRDHPVLVVPSGGFYGLRQNTQFKQALEAYVAGGGTAVVFAQQRGSDFSALPTPDGRPIQAYGWHEDNSCYTNGAYVETFHPILASQSQALVTSNLDGYFDGVPDNATVLLRRVKNGMPSMFLYPYGQGWVVVSASYDDWGGFNQSGPGAQAIIRDAISWAKKPADLPINAPGSSVSITLQVRNVTGLAASHVKLFLMSPSRDRVVAEQTLSVNIAPAETTEVAFTHSFPSNAELGIYHLDYELLDTAGITVQPVAEEDTGRIMVARPPAPFRPNTLAATTTMPGGEDVLAGEPTVFRYRVFNPSAVERRVKLYWNVNFATQGTPPALLDDLVIPPQSSVVKDVTLTLSGSWLYSSHPQRFWLYAFEPGGTPQPQPWWLFLFTFPPDTGAFQYVDRKGFTLHIPRVDVALQGPLPAILPGQTMTLPFRLTNRMPIPIAGRLDLKEEPSGSVVAQAPFSLEASEAETVLLGFTAPTVVGSAAYTASVDIAGVQRGRAPLRLVVVAPELRDRGLSLPEWSLTATNVVTWTLENMSVVPLTGGTVSARLRDATGAMLWEDVRALTLGASPDTGQVIFEVPALPPGYQTGFLTLEADNGFGKRIVRQSAVARALESWVRLSNVDYGAGQSGAVLVNVWNRGTVAEAGDVSVHIDGVGVLPVAPLNLPAGQQALLSLPFTVPADVSGVLHRGVVALPHGPPVQFNVAIRSPKLELVVEDLDYVVGESIPVVVRNTGGSRTTATVALDLEGRVRANATFTLDAGTETTVTLPPLPLHLASRRYTLLGTATDAPRGVHAALDRTILVSGTSATVTVATDSPTYTPAGALQATAQVTNGPNALSGGLLHLEISPPCVDEMEGGSFYVETWDGTSWVERAVRHRRSFFETDLIDLGAYLPDGAGEYKVRIRQQGTFPAFLDYVALLSAGALVPPVEAIHEFGEDVLADLLIADDLGPPLASSSVVVRFPASSNASLVFGGREGPGCETSALWQKDVPVDLAPGAVLDVAETLAAPATEGQYILTGELRTRDGDILERDTKTFEVVAGALAVSVGTDGSSYRTGTPVVVSGLVRNLSSAPEPEVTFHLYRQTPTHFALLHEETLALGPSESRSYSVTVDADPSSGQDLMTLQALVSSSSSTAVSRWSVIVADHRVSAELIVPDPAVGLIPTSARLVAALETDLDAVTHDDAGELVGMLPFPIALRGITYTGFRQAANGFLELVPDGGSPATEFSANCLDEFNADAIEGQTGEVNLDTAFVAAFLGDLHPGLSGFVGYKLYPAGSADRDGRGFHEDTLVFFWDAPTEADARRNKIQVLFSRSGIARIDAGDVFLPEQCARTGLVLIRGETFALSPVPPFGLRLESAVGRAAFAGLVRLQNPGPLASSVSVDYGRVGGARTIEAVTLAPNQAWNIRFEDVVTGPTMYSANVTGDVALQLERAVNPTEALVIAYTGDTTLIDGPALLPVTVTKTGVGGPVTVTFTLDGPAGPQAVTRTYDLEPGIPHLDRIPVTVPEGALSLAVSANVPVSSPTVALIAGPLERVIFTASAGAIAAGRLPISIDIANTGLSDFSGEVQVDGPGASRTAVAVPGGDSTHLDVEASLTGATAGPNTFTVRLLSEGGVLVGEQEFERAVAGGRVALVQSPAGQSFPAGTMAPLRFVLRNTGDQVAQGEFEFQVFDEAHAAAFDLAPGSEAEIVFESRIEDDVEEKVYEGRYVISTVGAPDTTGQVNFTVNGIALAVQGSLDQAAYADGETAHFTVEVTNGRPGLGTEYLARVHYGDFEELRPLSVAGTATTIFDVPLALVTGEPLFLGLSHPDGRSLYINTFRVGRRDDLAFVTVDAEVYAPGATVTVSAIPASPGTLTLSAPGFTETIAVTGTVTRSFVLPPDLPGGTYQVSWAFASAEGPSSSGSVPFDVAGVRVRVFEARLDKGGYASGEPIQTRLQIHTNEATTATLRAFIVDPEGSSQLAGEDALTLAPEADLMATHTWPFTSSVAGLHRLVYGIYRGENLLASGSLAFDVGEGAILGLRTDKPEYPLPTEAVQATVSAFVSGSVSLRLEVDGETVATPEVTGTGILEIAALLPGLPPGPHLLTAIAEGGSYTSRRSTSFSLGTSLPDLTPGSPFLRLLSGSSARIDVTVANAGRSDAATTDLVVRNVATGAVLGTTSVPGLASGASATVSLDWNPAGAAGSLEVEAVVDSANSLQEFREDNNRSTASLEVPALLFRATADPSYPANVNAGLGGVVANLSADMTFTGLRVEGAVFRPDGSAAPLAAALLGPVAPGANVPVSTPWAVGRSAPGTYLLQGQLVDAEATLLGTSSAAFDILPTSAFAGAVAATPNPAQTGGAVTLNGHILNQGNVAVSGTARFDLLTPGGTVAARQRVPAAVPLEGATDVSAVVEPLDVPPGEYGLDLRMEVLDQEYPVATSTLTVAGAGVEALLGSDPTSRVLVYVGGRPEDAAGRVRRTAFVNDALAVTGAFRHTTSNPLEFARLFRSGTWNTHVILTESALLLPLLADELREAAYRGDGVMLVQWGTGRTVALEPALGVTVGSQQSGNTHTLQVLAGPLGPPETIVVPGLASRLTLNGASLAGTMGSGVPVLSTHAYGRGRTVAMAFDPAVPAENPARPRLLALFARALGHVAPQQPRVAAPGVALPLAVSLHNAGATAQSIEVGLLVPNGVRIARLDDAPITTEPPVWQVSLPAGATLRLRFQALLPNETGSYTIGTSVRVNGLSVADPPTLSLQVTQRWEDSHASIIGSLEARTVSPQDAPHLQLAIGLLRTAQSLGTDLLGLEARIRLAAEASARLGRITSADVSIERAAIGHLIAAWERAWHDALPPAP